MAEIKHFITIETTPDKVYSALTTQPGLRSWWTADTTTDSRVGGKAEFGFDRQEVVFRMKIEQLEPGRKVVWSCHGDQPNWTGTRLTWEIAPEGKGASLRFAQTGLKALDDFWASCNSTWGELMFRLKDYLEGRNPGPLWKE